jgi:hypothetical protein
VTIGGTVTTTFTITDDTHIAATTPAGTAGAKDVVVTTPDGLAIKTGGFIYMESSGSGGLGGGGGGGGAPSDPGITSLAPYISADGVFNLAAVAKSEDGNVELDFAKGVQAKNKDGGALKSVSIKKMAEPPAVPVDTTIIGLVYEFGPAGTTFSPAITLTFHYDVSNIPKGVDEKKLVLATWDATAGKWVELQTTIDLTAHTVSVSISHFSSFTVIAHTRLAAFTIRDLSISPAEVTTEDRASVSVLVSNSGDLGGHYTVTLKINGKTESSRNVTVNGNSNQSVSFVIARDTAGNYKVDINGLSDTLTVRSPLSPAAFSVKSLAISPPEIVVGEETVISIMVENTGDVASIYTMTFKINSTTVSTCEVNLAALARQSVEYSAFGDTPGTYVVDVNGQAGSFTVKPFTSIPTTKGINWWLVGGIIGVVVGATMFVSLTTKRQTM